MTATFEGTALTVSTIERMPDDDPTGLEPVELGTAFTLREAERAEAQLHAGEVALEAGRITEEQLERLRKVRSLANRALGDVVGSVVGEQYNLVDGPNIIRSYN
jgi:hypothetical protein